MNINEFTDELDRAGIYKVTLYEESWYSLLLATKGKYQHLIPLGDNKYGVADDRVMINGIMFVRGKKLTEQKPNTDT